MLTLETRAAAATGSRVVKWRGRVLPGQRGDEAEHRDNGGGARDEDQTTGED